MPGGWQTEVPQDPQPFVGHEPRPEQDESEKPPQFSTQRKAPRKCQQCEEMKEQLREKEEELREKEEELQEKEEELREKEEELREKEEQLLEREEQLWKTEEQLLEKEAANEALQAAARDWKMELFESWKSAGRYDKAGDYYEDLLKDLIKDTGVEMGPRILDLKQSYVDMLIKQGGRFDEAVRLAEEVWHKREREDPMSDVSKESHRQLCSIYASLKRPDQAASRHRIAYEQWKGLENAWALENGDECCKRLAEQQKYDEAASMQAEVWTERQRAENGGPRHPDTIKSGKSRIWLLKKLSDTLADQAGSESQENLRRSERETCEHRIDQALRCIWEAAESPEMRTEILDEGHKLGDRLLARKMFSDAEKVLDRVWQGRRLAAGEADPQAMSTSKLLAAAVKLQDSTEKYRKAAAIYSQLWKVCKRVFGQGDDETISVGVELAATLYHLEQYSGDEGAEEVYRWVLEQKQIYSRKVTSTVVDARYNLGRAIYRQGHADYAEAAGLLQDVYDQWYEKAPDAASIRECGHMLIEIYEYRGLVDPLKALFDGRKGLESRDILYLESGYAYGRILVEQEGNHELAREPMRSLWEYEPALVEEKKLRLQCGRLYGQILLELEQHDLAQDVLQAVMNAQDGVFEAGSTEVTEVSQYLGEARRAISERNILRPRDRNIRGVAKPKRRRIVK